MRPRSMLCLAIISLSASIAEAQVAPEIGITAPPAKLRTQDFFLQADRIVFEPDSKRIVVEGNVQMNYGRYSLTTDRAVLDQARPFLMAEGHVVLRDPKSNLIRADRYALDSEFSDAFLRSVKTGVANKQIAIPGLKP